MVRDDANADRCRLVIKDRAVKLPKYPSPVSDGYKIWTVSDSKGIVNCIDVQSGKVFYASALKKRVTKSMHHPLLIGKRILIIDVNGKGYWLSAASAPSVNDAGTLVNRSTPAQRCMAPTFSSAVQPICTALVRGLVWLHRLERLTDYQRRCAAADHACAEVDSCGGDGEVVVKMAEIDEIVAKIGHRKTSRHLHPTRHSRKVPLAATSGDGTRLSGVRHYAGADHRRIELLRSIPS